MQSPDDSIISMKAHCHSQGRSRKERERGYVLLTLLLTLALMIIFAAAIVPTIEYQIQHDREDELIHRGVQYSRAIRAYYKKFGRYPVRLEDLESSNNQRFLRKRYKDPIGNQDFKLLHFGEVKLFGSAGLLPGQNGIANPPGLGGTPGLGASGPGQGGFSNNGFGAQSPSAFSNSSLGGNSGFGNSNSSFGSTLGSNQQTANQAGTDANAAQDASNSSSAAAGSAGGSSSATGSNAGDANNGSGGNNGNSGQPAGQVFGGGPIVGVVSTSKKDGYHEFNHKKKYSEWQFIYDPGTDRGGLLTTPNQPPLTPQGPPGQNANGQNNNGNAFGSGNSFGTPPSSLQNNQNSGSYGNSNPPNNQQQ